MLRRDPKRVRRRDVKRRYRARVRKGEIVAPVDSIDAEIVDFLTGTSWLAEAGAEDRREIGRAILRLLGAAAEWRKEEASPGREASPARLLPAGRVRRPGRGRGPCP
jgi:hypothetical protein